MSFDVFLQRFDKGEMAESPCEPVRQVLNATKHLGPDDFGFYNVTFADGVEVEFSAQGLESQEEFAGCAFHIRGFGRHLMEFIFRVARAGNMVIIPAMEGNPLILVSDEQKTNIPSDVLELLIPVVVGSADELANVLTGGFNDWSDYRDQVISKR